MKTWQKLKHLVIILFSTLVLSTTAVTIALASSATTPAAVATAKDENPRDRLVVTPVAPDETNALNPNPPSEPVKLIFIHHSVGGYWLDDNNGNLGQTLGANNYYVSDVTYNWGPDTIGTYTDTGHWWNWFRGSNSSTYLSALYSATSQSATYTRPMDDPGGEHEIIMFKSCYPNSHLRGSADDPPTTGDNPLRGQAWDAQVGGEYVHTVGNAKGIYNDILEYFGTRQDKLFIVITSPPLVESQTNAEEAARARAFHDWLVNDWLATYPYHNVAVFDFYNVITSNGGDSDTNDLGWETGNHHRYQNGSIEHTTDQGSNYSQYGGYSDSHPSPAGGQKASGEYLPLLNIFYNCWKHGDCEAGGTADWIAVDASPGAMSIESGKTAVYTISLTANAGYAAPVSLNLQGAPAGATTHFSQNPLTPPGVSQLYITTTASSASGTYPLTITASSGTLGDAANVSLTVNPTSAAFTLGVSPPLHIAEPNQKVSYTVSVTGIDGFNQPVDLDVVDIPLGVNASWTVNPVMPGNTTTLRLSISGTAIFGHYTLQVIGKSGTLTVPQDLQLIISHPYKIFLPCTIKLPLAKSNLKTPGKQMP